MPNVIIPVNSLVSYKNHPARVIQSSDKLEIEIAESLSDHHFTTLKVRPKDVIFLHPGPLKRLEELQALEGDVNTAWELLSDTSVALREFAEMIYGIDSPAATWAAWQLLLDGIYFSGDPQSIHSRSELEVNRDLASRKAHQDQKQSLETFFDRLRLGQILPEDDRYVQDVIDLGLEQKKTCQILRLLGRSETPQVAHATLLEWRVWDSSFNPYPIRLGLERQSPQIALPELPVEPRLDLTDLPAFAIDDEGNLEPDDAISLDADQIWVHIADVAGLVPPDSPVDLLARQRAANLYLPERTVRLLPDVTVGRLGLGLEPISPAISFGLRLNENGEISNFSLNLSWVKVQRMTYAQAEEKLEQDPFQRLYNLTQSYFRRRKHNAAVFVDLPEIKIAVVDGIVEITPLPQIRSRDMVREAMVMAGEGVAMFANTNRISIPYLTQDAPEQNEFPQDLAGLFALRRSLRRSQISVQPAPHGGLGLPLYTRATSPLRRYLDLVTHQQLRTFIRRERGDDRLQFLDERAILERIGSSEAIIGSINQAEMLSRRHWTLVYLIQHPGWEGVGVIVEKQGLRVKIFIPALAFEFNQYLRFDLPLNSTVFLHVKSISLPDLEAFFQVSL